MLTSLPLCAKVLSAQVRCKCFDTIPEFGKYQMLELWKHVNRLHSDLCTGSQWARSPGMVFWTVVSFVIKCPEEQTVYCDSRGLALAN